MNLRFIETFVLLARLGNFRAVAQRLNTTQPAVSARIVALERELGVTLFVRSGRGATLTPEGTEALRHAETMMAGWTAMRQAAAGPESYAGSVRVGAIDAVVRTWLPGLIERLGTALPKATVEITADTSINLTRGVASGDIHMAVLIDPPGGAFNAGSGEGTEGRAWATRPLCAFAMAWVASPALVDRERKLSIADLARLPIITYPVDTPPYRLIADYLGEGALPRRPASSSNSLSTMIRLAADGLGLAAIPPACIARQLEDGDLVVVPVEKPFRPLTLHALARGPEPAPLVGLVLDEAEVAAHAFCTGSDPTMAWVGPNAP